MPVWTLRGTVAKGSQRPPSPQDRRACVSETCRHAALQPIWRTCRGTDSQRQCGVSSQRSVAHLRQCLFLSGVKLLQSLRTCEDATGRHPLAHQRLCLLRRRQPDGRGSTQRVATPSRNETVYRQSQLRPSLQYRIFLRGRKDGGQKQRARERLGRIRHRDTQGGVQLQREPARSSPSPPTPCTTTPAHRSPISWDHQ